MFTVVLQGASKLGNLRSKLEAVNAICVQYYSANGFRVEQASLCGSVIDADGEILAAGDCSAIGISQSALVVDQAGGLGRYHAGKSD